MGKRCRSIFISHCQWDRVFRAMVLHFLGWKGKLNFVHKRNVGWRTHCDEYRFSSTGINRTKEKWMKQGAEAKQERRKRGNEKREKEVEVARKLFDDVRCVTVSFFFYLCFSYFSCPWPRNFPFQRDLLFECRDSKHREYWQCMLYYENCWRGNFHTWKDCNSSFWESWERWFLLILTDYCEDALHAYLWAYE